MYPALLTYIFIMALFFPKISDTSTSANFNWQFFALCIPHELRTILRFVHIFSCTAGFIHCFANFRTCSVTNFIHWSITFFNFFCRRWFDKCYLTVFLKWLIAYLIKRLFYKCTVLQDGQFGGTFKEMEWFLTILAILAIYIRKIVKNSQNWWFWLQIFIKI